MSPLGLETMGQTTPPIFLRPAMGATIVARLSEVILQKQKRYILCFSLTSAIKDIIIRMINIATEYMTHERIIFCIFAKYLSHLTWNT